MDIRENKIFQFLFGPLLTVIVFFMQSYRANRDRLDAWMTRQNVASFFRFLAILILAIWLFTFALSPEERRQQLTDEVREGFSDLKTFRKQVEQPAQPADK